MKNLMEQWGRSCMLLAALAYLLILTCLSVSAMPAEDDLLLNSKSVHNGDFAWKMQQMKKTSCGEEISLPGFDTSNWLDAVVPGTVLTSLVHDGIYPDPYFGTNNRLQDGRIPDIAQTGRDFYTYWFRTEFTAPTLDSDDRLWLKADGINYTSEIWVNGNMLCSTKGMFKENVIDISSYIRQGKPNALAILVHPINMPGKLAPKTWGAKGEFHNGGNGDIGANVTQLMTVGWDFTFNDGIRDRNTGIWRPISIYRTGRIAIRHPFVKSSLSHPNYDQAQLTVSAEIFNSTTSNTAVNCEVRGEIVGEGISFSTKARLIRGAHQVVTFTPKDFPALTIQHPRLWWPVHKGKQEMYMLKMKVLIGGMVTDSVTTSFGIREVTTTRNTPDKSKMFIVNGRPLFVRGSNWVPDAMLRCTYKRMESQLRYTAQSGINMLRLWAGGIAEDDKFYELCDRYGILVWQEFWLTGDTRHPQDEECYMANLESTVKRLRNHPSLAFYVGSNEGADVVGTRELINMLDGSRPYQVQSETDGVHDGSPYKQVNPMKHYLNKASERGSRVDGFNPEYGAPTMPLVESLKKMMPAADLWPVRKSTWDYLDGGGFHLMSTMYQDLTNAYGRSSSIEEYARKGQLVGAMNSKSIWEVWNYNKFSYGDRFCSGLLFWYHNNTMPQTCARMWDYYLQPTASLYHTMHALEPLHVQFDYAKNTVSVVNDYNAEYRNMRVTAEVYDLNSKKVWSGFKAVSVPSDGVANDVIKIAFPSDITKVHFLNLRLYDATGKVVSENFYWRSTDKYQGDKTLTGPCASGFESLGSMPRTKVAVTVKAKTAEGRMLMTVSLKNSTPLIAFFNELELQNADGSLVHPVFASDNFFTLMPGESRIVTIDVDQNDLKKDTKLRISGWNIDAREYKL